MSLIKQFITSSLVKQCSALILALVACLIIGLGMQFRSMQYEVHRGVEDKALGEVMRRADECAADFERLTTAGADLDAASSTWVQAHDARLLAERGGILVLDPEWRLLASLSESDSAGVALPAVGAAISWVPLDRPTGGAQQFSPGHLTLDGQTCIAASRKLNNGLGYVVAYLPMAVINAQATALTSSMPKISLILLMWTVASFSIATYIIHARTYEHAEQQRLRSNAETVRRAQSLIRTQESVIFGLAKLADSRDTETGAHLERISAYSTALTATLQRHSKYSIHITSAFKRLIALSSALHDIGKVGVSDDILLKPGPLTPDERAEMQKHTLIGGHCLREIEQKLGSSNFLQMAREIAYAHHEWWDGTGYPKGLKGEAIPLGARIVAIADVYDALASERPYKKAYPHEKCVELIRKNAGTQFDPQLVEIWLAIEFKFREIALRHVVAKPARVAASQPESEPELEPVSASSGFAGV